MDEPSKFRRLSYTHAAMMGGDAAMIVALADSLFFSIDPSAARWRVLLFLVVSFAPFLVIAPLIGPAIDRAAGGRRHVVIAVAGLRIALAVAMAAFVTHLALFPLVFAALVLQKSYIVSKQALVPSVVRTERDLVEANSKLGLIAGIAGTVAVFPAGILQKTAGAPTTMIYSGVCFAVALYWATRLAPDVVASSKAPEAEKTQLHSKRLVAASTVMTVIRGLIGFTFFHLAFWLRSGDGGTVWFGAAVGGAAFATMVGNWLSPWLRIRVGEEKMLRGALVLCAIAGFGAAVLPSRTSGILLFSVMNLAAAVSRLAFESIVQRDAPGANRGRAFAQFETRFQFAWAACGLVPVVIELPGALGFAIVGVVAAGCLASFVSAVRNQVRARVRVPAAVLRDARAKVRGRPARSASAPSQDDPAGA